MPSSVPPFASAASWNASTARRDFAVRDIIVPLPKLAGFLLKGLVTKNIDFFGAVFGKGFGANPKIVVSPNNPSFGTDVVAKKKKPAKKKAKPAARKAKPTPLARECRSQWLRGEDLNL